MISKRVHLVGLSLALLPFSQGVGQFEMGVITFSPHILLVFALIVLGVFRVILSGKRYDFASLDVWMILLLATYFSSTVLSDTLIRSGFLVFHGLFLPAACYFLIKSNIESYDEMKVAINWLIIGVFIFCIIVFLTLLQTKQRTVVLGVPPIGFATLTVMSCIYLYGMGYLKSKVGKLMFFVLFVGFLTALSRMYIVLTIASIFFYMIIRRGDAAKLLKLMLFSTLFLSLLLVASAGFFAGAKSNVEDRRSVGRVLDLEQWKHSLHARAYDYKGAVDAFKERPFFGSGLKKGEFTVTRHNLHMEWIEYGGALGYILYMGVIFSMFKRPSRVAPSDKLVAAGLLASFMILCNSVTNGLMHGMMPYAVFIIAGINAVLVTYQPKVGISEEIVKERVSANRRILHKI